MRSEWGVFQIHQIHAEVLVKEESLQDAGQTLEATVQAIDNILLNVEQSSGNIYWKMMGHINQPDKIKDYTHKLVETNPYITDCKIIWDSDSDAIDINTACWTEPSKDNTNIISFLLPIFIEQQKTGVLTVDMSLAQLSKVVLETKLSPNSFCALLGKNGSFIVYPDSSILNMNVLELVNDNPSVAEAAEDRA